ncbi:MAG: AMP-binding protein [Sphingomonadaceae bacterium]
MRCAFGNLFDLVGIFLTGGTTGPSKGANVTNLGWGTMIVAWFPPESVARFAYEAPEKLDACGKVTRSVKVALLDDDGNEVPCGEASEICAHGAPVTHSYFEKPEATAEIRQFGWHHTGDVGEFDEDSYLYIVDRKKDMVATGGFNLFTSEVEAAITELPQVREAAVFGIPHE